MFYLNFRVLPIGYKISSLLGDFLGFSLSDGFKYGK